MDLGIRVEGEGSRRVVALSGECDIATAPQLREALAEVRRPGVTELILDLSGLEFLDSTGLGVMIGALKRIREGGGELKVAGAHGPVLRVFELTGLDKALPFFPSVEAAG